MEEIGITKMEVLCSRP